MRLPDEESRFDLEEARPRVGPVGERADGDLMLEPSPGLRRAATAAGDRPAGADEQPLQRRNAHLPHQRGRRGPDRELPARDQAIQQRGHKWLQAFGPDLAGGLPEDLRGTADVGAVPPWPADRPATHATGGQGAQAPQDRLSVIAGHGHHLRQQAAAVGSRQAVIPFALPRQILSDTRPRHGYPLGRGNRTCATDPPSPVTIILRRCVLLTVTPCGASVAQLTGTCAVPALTRRPVAPGLGGRVSMTRRDLLRAGFVGGAILFGE